MTRKVVVVGKTRSALLLGAVLLKGSNLWMMTAAQTLQEWSFAADSQGFVYEDDLFRGTSEPNYADGIFSDGAIQVTLGGVDGDAVFDMSGGWSKNFTNDQVLGDVDIAVEYSVDISPEYEDGEYVEVMCILFDNSRGVFVLEDFVLDSFDASDESEETRIAVVSVGTLSLGSYTLFVGAFHNQKTTISESATIHFYRILLETTPQEDSIPSRRVAETLSSIGPTSSPSSVSAMPTATWESPTTAISSSLPTPISSSVPTTSPTSVPTSSPTSIPSSRPTETAVPSGLPSATPVPTSAPTTAAPTRAPTAQPTRVQSAFPTVPADTRFTDIYINCGNLDDEFTDTAGNVWGQDDYYEGESETRNANRKIQGTQNDDLYNSNRNGLAFVYDIPIFPGRDYDIFIHFAELDVDFVDERVFNVSVNGEVKLENVDIILEAGAKSTPLVKYIFMENVAANSLRIEFTSVIRDALVSAISVNEQLPHFAHAVPGGPYTGVDRDDTGFGFVDVNGDQSHTHSVVDSLIEWNWYVGDQRVEPNATGEITSLYLPVGVHSVFLDVIDSGGNFDGLATTVEVKPFGFPFIDLLSPDSGMVGDLQDSMNITGVGFTFTESQTSVWIGPWELTGPEQITVLDENTIFVHTVPDGRATAGPVDVTVRTPIGTSPAVVYEFIVDDPFDFEYGELPTFIFLPTIVKFGPDGKLYVTTQLGYVYKLTLDDDFNVIDTVESAAIASTAGINPYTGDQDFRSILGMTFDPSDLKPNPTVYLATSILFHKEQTAWVGRAVNGKITTLGGPDLDEMEDIITGLPVSDLDHAVNGLEFGQDGELYIQVGGNTNAGVPGKLSTSRTMVDNYYSSATLVAYLTLDGFDGSLTYDADNGNPTGGLGVEVFAPGQRNPFDIVLHSNGFLYGTDNGPNRGFGDRSTGCLPGQTGKPPSEPDELNLIEQGKWYGHANRKRGETDPKQCIWRSVSEEGVANYTAPLALLRSSTNGIIEFESDHFNGQLRGQLIMGKYAGGLFRGVLEEDGRSSTEVVSIPTLIEGGLQLTQAPDGSIFVARLTKHTVAWHRPVEAPSSDLVVKSAFPRRGPRNGGMTITLYGENFGESLVVTVGGAVCTDVVVVNDKKMTCRTPPGTGNSDIVVSTDTQNATMAIGHRYTNTDSETLAPTSSPTPAPSPSPSLSRSDLPSSVPTLPPSDIPSSVPTLPLSDVTSNAPTHPRSDAPSIAPTRAATDVPSSLPTRAATDVPTSAPASTLIPQWENASVKIVYKGGDFCPSADMNVNVEVEAETFPGVPVTLKNDELGIDLVELTNKFGRAKFAINIPPPDVPGQYLIEACAYDAGGAASCSSRQVEVLCFAEPPPSAPTPAPLWDNVSIKTMYKGGDFCPSADMTVKVQVGSETPSDVPVTLKNDELGIDLVELTNKFGRAKFSIGIATPSRSGQYSIEGCAFDAGGAAYCSSEIVDVSCVSPTSSPIQADSPTTPTSSPTITPSRGSSAPTVGTIASSSPTNTPSSSPSTSTSTITPSRSSSAPTTSTSRPSLASSTSPTVALTTSAAPSLGQALSPIHLINCGGGAYLSPTMGLSWAADQFFNSGKTFGNGLAIANTDDDTIYQTERFGRSGRLRYELPVSPGVYTVELHFAEIFGNTVGFRVFDVSIEGALVLDNYDIVAVAGSGFTARIETFADVMVTDGSLTIAFSRVQENPKVNAIAVYSQP